MGNLWTYLLGLPDECDTSRPTDVIERRFPKEQKPDRRVNVREIDQIKPVKGGKR
jgi:hypothetical protein